nr:ribonuclease H-like domain-containing protein [Tanacetum cinerariifolium]
MAGNDNDGDHPETSNTSPLVPPPTQQIPHTVSSIKLPILKREYDIWAIKMEHYLSHTDDPIWQVIHNGNGLVSVTTDTNGIIKVLPPKTAEEVVGKERERKARTTLLMALLEDHLEKFHKMADAKEMLQTLLSQLEIHGVGVSHEDANQKFLRSLPSSWSQVALIIRTKPGLDTLSFDDIYNNLKGFERDVEGTTASSSNTQNVAFVSTENTSSTNEINNDDMEEMDLKWQGILLEIAELKETKTAEEEMMGTIETKLETMEDAQNYAMMAYSSSNSGSNNEASDLEDTPVNDRFAYGMHAVPPPMTGNYMPSGPDVEIYYSKFTYGTKQTLADESDFKPSDYAFCQSDSSVETSTSMPKLVENA